MTISIWAIIIVNITNILGALGTYYLKKSTKSLKLSLSSIVYNKDLIIGVLLFTTGLILFIPVLKYGELSVLYPFVALTYVWSVIFSIKFLKEKKLIKSRFEWQEGFGAFSYAHSQLTSVINYINNQEQHHKKKTFKEEYFEFLAKFKVEYNIEYLFDFFE